MTTINKSDFGDDDFYPNDDSRLSNKMNSSIKVLGYKHDDKSGTLLKCVKLQIKEIENGVELIRDITITPNYDGSDPNAEGMGGVPEVVKKLVKWYDATNQSKEGNCS
ncbi:hypothetical protein [Flagellimonas myxillae]|uniref:hypothetical protein n=1 Tax=Flagellimonas myxillae TaxID=2942214 RepID=UPI00201FA7E5|nr:hypothetical protein [Muricauda myxillae]MCL6264920.1 hypothetical protein [Muricauda myxillae]